MNMNQTKDKLLYSAYALLNLNKFDTLLSKLCFIILIMAVYLN